MFELCKEILQKVSFDKLLFKKELIKAKKWLKKEEIILLEAWCMASFVHYKDVITEVFSGS
jgi:hypothetical protein